MSGEAAGLWCLPSAVSGSEAEGREKSGAGQVGGDAGARTSIERHWVGARARALGPIESHVRFMQWVFRCTRSVRPGSWRAGRLRFALKLASAFGRHPRNTQCMGGENLAGEREFEAQAALSSEMLDWYALYVALLRRLQSGRTPFALQNFCGGGGSSEGCRRAGGASHGIDLYSQPDYVRRFGPDCFTAADGMSWAEIKRLKERHRADFMIGGPPCKFYSRARVKGVATQPPLINGFRDMCVALFGEKGKWAIENVMGAIDHMSKEAVVLDGAYFGLRVARARLYETNFALHVDACVRQPADTLAARCCLGCRRRFRRFDEFGRPAAPCCAGNIFAVQGTAPWRCTAAECARAMGCDETHMSYERLAQSVPPQYGQLVFAQMCMRHAHDVYGVPVITFDEMRARPAWARRTLAFWLRGAGAPGSHAGMLFQPAPKIQSEAVGMSRAEFHGAKGCEREAEFRELHYSHAGGYDQQWVRPGLEGRLGRVSEGVTLVEEPTEVDMLGRNTYIEVEGPGTMQLARRACNAAARGGSGTRATVVAPVEFADALHALGYRPLPCRVGGKGPDALSYKQLVAVHVGRRAGVRSIHRLVHEDVLLEMDTRDQGGFETDPVEKARFTWQDFPHDADRFKGKGLPGWVEKMMVEGAVVDEGSDVIAKDHQQYMWPDGVAMVEAVLETDRHLAIGALEYVPDGEVESVLREQVVHPILLVSQGKGKFRACHDYSRGTNNTARTAPFLLPSVWDARAAVKPGSYFCKYDLRDGFFSIPIHPDSRNRLVVRHPATGRLLRCARLPFGYIDSPRLFCGLTEAVADLVRQRMAGQGVHVYVFVDDFLIVGDSRESARKGGEALEQVLHELGIPWAPHKQRGPARCMEFLASGFCCPTCRVIGASRSRRSGSKSWKNRSVSG